MAKLYFPEWIVILSTIVMVLCIFVGGFILKFNTVWSYILIVTVLLAIYILTFVFKPHLNEKGEKNLEDDVELLKLEKEHSSLLWMFTTGVGVAFLIPGVPQIETKPLMAIMGLILLIAGNLVFSYFYYPRYLLLIRKRELVLDSKEEILGEIVSSKNKKIVAYLLKNNKRR